MPPHYWSLLISNCTTSSSHWFTSSTLFYFMRAAFPWACLEDVGERWTGNMRNKREGRIKLLHGTVNPAGSKGVQQWCLYLWALLITIMQPTALLSCLEAHTSNYFTVLSSWNLSAWRHLPPVDTMSPCFTPGTRLSMRWHQKECSGPGC